MLPAVAALTLWVTQGAAASPLALSAPVLVLPLEHRPHAVSADRWGHGATNSPNASVQLERRAEALAVEEVNWGWGGW